ncbi:mCG1027961, partial [Mus musculus]
LSKPTTQNRKRRQEETLSPHGHCRQEGLSWGWGKHSGCGICTHPKAAWGPQTLKAPGTTQCFRDTACPPSEGLILLRCERGGAR